MARTWGLNNIAFGNAAPIVKGEDMVRFHACSIDIKTRAVATALGLF